MIGAIVTSTCCCSCRPKRDFLIQMRFRATCEFYRRIEVITDVGCDSPPDCSLPDLPCTCPTIGDCQAIYAPDSPSICENGGHLAHYITSFDMAPWTVTVPYVSTGAEFVNHSSGCTWYADPFGTGLLPSGLNYVGFRTIDINSTTLEYDVTVSTCAGCVTLTPNLGGAYSQNLTVKYYHRAIYSTPPAYMSLQRNPAAGFANWTWEITGGVFITRNGAGVVQNALNLAGLTMEQATVAIDAWPETIAVGQPLKPAAAWPATMWQDRVAASIPFPAAGAVFIFPPGPLVEHYQEGIMGPRWAVEQDSIAPCNLGVSFALKVGCDMPDPMDYEGGTDEAAEKQFCKGIGVAFSDYETQYDPISEIGETNFRLFCANVNNLPTGHWSCEGGELVWIETPCTIPTGDPGINYWGICLGAYGNKAMEAASTFEVCSDDPGLWAPTFCFALAEPWECDFCPCPPEEGPGFSQGCAKTFQRQGWALSKYFSITRL
jgi:hypothetical protein